VRFASLVDDPSGHPEQFPTEQAQDQERLRLFRLMEALITWENSNNQEVLALARAEIHKSTGDNPPPLLDPFAGGGSIPLEAQRLGLEVHASDLNPVAVLIDKALIEIPPKFANRAPVNPEAKQSLLGRDWHGAQGLADDIRYYGRWIRDEAERRIGHLYPKVTLSREYGRSEAKVIAWLWVRTVICPNPACGAHMPLASKWWLSKKKGKEAWIELQIDHQYKTIKFEVRAGHPTSPQIKTIDAGSCVTNSQGKKTKAAFECMVCKVGIAKGDYIDDEANRGRMGIMPLAMVVDGKQGRVYLPVNDVQAALEQALLQLSTPTINKKIPTEPARGTFASNAQGRIYGFKTFADYFTPRQLVSLISFSNLLPKVREQVLEDAHLASLALDKTPLNNGDTSATAYADAITTYLGLGLSKLVDYNCTNVTWSHNRDQAAHAFTKQGLSMVWDFAEVNPLAGAAGDLTVTLNGIADVLEKGIPALHHGLCYQLDAALMPDFGIPLLISTDPPYYDNVSYADLADFFYIWLRRSLSSIYPDLFSTTLVPKTQELVVAPYRFNGDKDKARQFFEMGLGKAFERMRAIQHMDYPLTVYYAFKQSESETDTIEEDDSNHSPMATSSTGWETMLEGLIRSGFTITGTWPIRTERATRSIGLDTNVLASSIVLVCRPRPVDATIASRRQFLNALRAELPGKLKKLQHGSIAPVDLAQASIGPGMAIYSRYSKVVESDGSSMRVRTALQLINRALDEALAEQEGEYDAETRWAIAWFEQYAMNAGEYGIAETLSKAKNTSVQSLVDAGFLEARGGKVRLLKREELSRGWKPKANPRLTVWEVMQRMIHALLSGSGEVGAGDILRQASTQGEVARDLAYRLYTVCERKGWAQEALAYNSLVTSWSEISRLAHREASDQGLWGATYLG